MTFSRIDSYSMVEESYSKSKMRRLVLGVAAVSNLEEDHNLLKSS